MWRESLGDRRRDLRFEIVGRLWGSLTSVESFAVRSLGPGGVLLEGSVQLDVDSIHTLRLKVNGEFADVDARVRHATPVLTSVGIERYLIGLEFLSIDEGLRRNIEALVHAADPHAPPSSES